jgi:hypothetical protein
LFSDAALVGMRRMGGRDGRKGREQIDKDRGGINIMLSFLTVLHYYHSYLHNKQSGYSFFSIPVALLTYSLSSLNFLFCNIIYLINIRRQSTVYTSQRLTAHHHVLTPNPASIIDSIRVFPSRFLTRHARPQLDATLPPFVLGLAHPYF